MEITMARTQFTRGKYKRETKQYSSDLSDAEREIVQPLLPGRNRLCRVRIR